MKKVLYYRLVMLSVISVAITFLFTTFIFYQKYQRQVIDDLKGHAHILASAQDLLGEVETAYDPKMDNLRITVISSDGTVLYDSNADADTMENHADRPEVKEAFQAGSGYDIRESDTLAERTYYYAERLGDGSVIRVAKVAGSIWNFYGSILPVLVGLIIAVIALSVLMSRFMARQLIQPVEQLAMNLDNEEIPEHTYEELKPFLDKIHAQHHELKDNARLRQEFTANVSHELKTPLTSISGYAELIETGIAGAGDTVHFAAEIHKNANRLLNLINDIIYLSKLDVMSDMSGVEKVNLCELAFDSVDMLQLHAKKHNVTLQYEKKESQALVDGNRHMLEEVIYNLCDNAIRYNRPNGFVRVSVYHARDAVVLDVSDNGIGISKEDQERIFERFYRVDKGRSKETGGTGLGLAIVKHIVEQHGAKLLLNSTVGKGTRIQVWFKETAYTK